MSGLVVQPIGEGADTDHSFVRRRGGRERSLETDGLRFTQYLTDGDSPERPFVAPEGDVVCLWDGAFYGLEGSTGTALVELYRSYGPEIGRHLDGDFALAVYDLGRRRAVLVTDAFATKPLHRRGTAVASTPSALGPPGAAPAAGDTEHLPPNTVTVIELASGEHRRVTVLPFDFRSQEKGAYDDWIAAFSRAVEKRAVDGAYLPLSAGYDSGAIHCVVDGLGLDVAPYSIEGVENVELLRRRNAVGEILFMDGDGLDRWTGRLRRIVEPGRYRTVNFDGERIDKDFLDDPATAGLALVHSRARAAGRTVFLSGTGADEILAANRHWPEGRFPEPLEPWPDFAGNWQRAYLVKEEHVAGAFGAEGRYPFLDRAQVQEFLWLAPELKHRRYKAPLHELMELCDYPFDEGVKTGFTPLVRTPQGIEEARP